MRFTTGDHLQVRRPIGSLGYYHHGIYVTDDRVIQFGGRVGDKRRATIEAVPLAVFEDGGIAKVVAHDGRTWFGAPRFPGLPLEEVVRRAEWLLGSHPEGLYDLFGYNCEQAANFCSTGAYESYQVRGFFSLSGLSSIPLMLYLAKRRRQGSPLSRKAAAAIAALLVIQLVPHFLYYARGERFMRRVGRPWMDQQRQE